MRNALLALVALALVAVPAAHAAPQQHEGMKVGTQKLEGNVAFVSPVRLVVRGDDGDAHNFVLTEDSVLPRSLNEDDRITIWYVNAPAGDLMATKVTVTGEMVGEPGGMRTYDARTATGGYCAGLVTEYGDDRIVVDTDDGVRTLRVEDDVDVDVGERVQVRYRTDADIDTAERIAVYTEDGFRLPTGERFFAGTLQNVEQDVVVLNTIDGERQVALTEPGEMVGVRAGDCLEVFYRGDGDDILVTEAVQLDDAYCEALEEASWVPGDRLAARTGGTTVTTVDRDMDTTTARGDDAGTATGGYCAGLVTEYGDDRIVVDTDDGMRTLRVEDDVDVDVGERVQVRYRTEADVDTAERIAVYTEDGFRLPTGERFFAGTLQHVEQDVVVLNTIDGERQVALTEPGEMVGVRAGDCLELFYEGDDDDILVTEVLQLDDAYCEALEEAMWVPGDRLTARTGSTTVTTVADRDADVDVDMEMDREMDRGMDVERTAVVTTPSTTESGLVCSGTVRSVDTDRLIVDTDEGVREMRLRPTSERPSDLRVGTPVSVWYTTEDEGDVATRVTTTTTTRLPQTATGSSRLALLGALSLLSGLAIRFLRS